MNRGGKPRIVHVITQLELGGAQQNTLDTCARLDRERFDVYLLAGHGGLLDAEAARIEKLDLRLLHHLVRPIAPLADRKAFVEIRGHLRQIRSTGTAPLLVHTHSSKAGIVGRLAARAVGATAIVHTIHGFGHPAIRNPILRRFAIATERYLAPRTDRFIAVSRANIDEGRALGLFRTTPVELIRSGFSLDAFAAPTLTQQAARDALRVPLDSQVVGMVACLKPQKAPLDFVDTAASIARRRPGVHFVLAGDGELREAVEARIAAKGLRERFHVLGWRDDIPLVLRALDVFMLTSRWEGLPRSVVQALASGVPVVANRVDGVADVIEDRRTGFVVEPGDIESAAARTLDLLADPALGARFIAAAQPLLPEFDVHAMVAAQESLYDALLAARA